MMQRKIVNRWVAGFALHEGEWVIRTFNFPCYDRDMYWALAIKPSPELLKILGAGERFYKKGHGTFDLESDALRDLLKRANARTDRAYDSYLERVSNAAKASQALLDSLWKEAGKA